MEERRHNLIDLVERISQLTVIVGNLTIAISEIKVSIKELQKKMEAEDRELQDRMETEDKQLFAKVSELQNAKNTIIGFGIAVTTIISALISFFNQKLQAIFLH